MRQTSVDGWEMCPPGEIARLGEQLRRRRQWRTARRTAGVVAAGLLLTVGTGLLVSSARMPDPLGGLTHAQIMDLAPSYQEGALSPELRERVERHLSHCEMCSQKYREMGLIAGTEDPDQRHAEALAIAMIMRSAVALPQAAD